MKDASEAAPARLRPHVRPGLRRLSIGAGIAMAAGLAFAGLQSAAAADWNGRLVLDKGHADAVHVELSGDALDLKLREDITGSKVVRDPDSVVLHVTDAARAQVPDDPQYAFLGTPGQDFWMIPQVQDPDVIWAGWNTEEIEAGQLRGNTLTLTLSGVSGPAAPVKLFATGTFGQPTPLIDSLGGLLEIPVPVNSHVHANWAFFEAGVYDLTFRADAALADGTPVTGSATYQFVVGPLPSTEPTPTPTDPTPSPTDPTPTPTDPTPSPTDPTPSPTNPTPSPTDPSPSPTDPTDPPGPGAVSQEIRASIGAGGGSLVLSVDPDDRSVVLPAAVLAPSGDRWRSDGELRPVRVTDTRAGSPGWNVAGRVGGFSGDAGEMTGSVLGWTPLVAAQPEQGGVVAGSPVPAGVGSALSASSTLASAAAGGGRGTSVLGAGVQLSAPADTATGAYTATLTLTVI